MPPKKRSWFIRFLIKPPAAVTEEVVEYYRRNPDELDFVVNKEELRLGFFRVFFLLGLLLAFGARVTVFFFGAELGPFMTDVVLDLVFELGNAILGGVVAAFLLEYLQKKQYEENQRFRLEVKRRLEQDAPR